MRQPVPLSAPLPPPARAAAAVPAPVPPRWLAGSFLGMRDDALLAPLRDAPLRRVRFNRGGSSISLRLELEGGARAAFKPDQTNYQTIPRKEIAAFRLDRLLGIGAVPPAVPRSFTRAELLAKLESRELAPRLGAEVRVNKDGTVDGEVSFWIPEIVDAKVGDYPVDSVDGMVLWKRWLRVGAPVPPDAEALVPQLSTLVAFDFLINNTDRWSGSNAKASPDGRMLFFMDNTLSFGNDGRGHRKCQLYLERVQKFSRGFYRSLKQLSDDDVREAMTRDTGPYRKLLTDREIEALLARRDRLVAYIDELVDEHGEAAVLVFE